MPTTSSSHSSRWALRPSASSTFRRPSTCSSAPCSAATPPSLRSSPRPHLRSHMFAPAHSLSFLHTYQQHGGHRHHRHRQGRWTHREQDRNRQLQVISVSCSTFSSSAQHAHALSFQFCRAVPSLHFLVPRCTLSCATTGTPLHTTPHTSLGFSHLGCQAYVSTIWTAFPVCWHPWRRRTR